ncbi:MAG: hypothetical protein ABIJ41_01850 [Candidatus Omnitrophota bacterium]
MGRRIVLYLFIALIVYIIISFQINKYRDTASELNEKQFYHNGDLGQAHQP